MTDLKPTKGRLLVAEPSILNDTAFNRSVVLLTEHNKSGSIGFIMNKPMKYKMRDLVPEIDCNFPIYNGGPVSQENLYFIHNIPKLIPASVFAKEYDYDTCVLVNEKKQVVEAINGNIFLVAGSTIATPPLSEGCMNGIIRNKLIEIVAKSSEFKLEERPISPFELKKTDEVFITNSIIDIQSVSNYRKKVYTSTVADQLKVLLKKAYT